VQLPRQYQTPAAVRRRKDADVYSLKMILQDWNDIECTQILQTIRRRVKLDGRIFIVEHIVPEPSESHFSKLFDIHMMCWGTARLNAGLLL
jgi:hypothetical protein